MFSVLCFSLFMCFQCFLLLKYHTWYIWRLAGDSCSELTRCALACFPMRREVVSNGTAILGLAHRSKLVSVLRSKSIYLNFDLDCRCQFKVQPWANICRLFDTARSDTCNWGKKCRLFQSSPNCTFNTTLTSVSQPSRLLLAGWRLWSVA